MDMDVDDFDDVEDNGEPGDEDHSEDPLPDGVLLDLANETAETERRLRKRKREVNRTDMGKIEACFRKLVSTEQNYTCCTRYCLHELREKDRPYLLHTSSMLRKRLTTLTIGEQNHMVYELLRVRWSVWRRPNGRLCVPRDLHGKPKRSYHRGYAIPEVHNGTRICRCTRL
jgi:hypothetical protein